MDRYDKFNMLELSDKQNKVIAEIVEIKSKYYQGEDYCTSELVDVYVQNYYKYIGTVATIIKQLDPKSLITFTQDRAFNIASKLHGASFVLDDILQTQSPSVAAVTSLMQDYSEALSYQYIITGLKINGSAPENKLHYLSDIYGDINMPKFVYEDLCENVQTKLIQNTDAGILNK